MACASSSWPQAGTTQLWVRADTEARYLISFIPTPEHEVARSEIRELASTVGGDFGCALVFAGRGHRHDNRAAAGRYFRADRFVGVDRPRQQECDSDCR